MIIEDAGRNHPTVAVQDGLCLRRSGLRQPPLATWPPIARERPRSGQSHRWADPDAGGSGVSGPPTSSVGTAAAPWDRFINNSATPMGGPSSCPWTTNNCGLSDEPFSLHPGRVSMRYIPMAAFTS